MIRGATTSRLVLARAASRRKPEALRSAFTLVELLVVIAIIGILTSLVLVGMVGVQETARADRTRAQIARVDALLAERWDAYRARRVPVRKPLYVTPVDWANPKFKSMLMAQARVDAMRELIRMELPDRYADLLALPGPTPTVSLDAPPALWRAYRMKIRQEVLKNKSVDLGIGPDFDTKFADWLTRPEAIRNQGAECLYLILSQMVEDDRSAMEFFAANEIVDTDSDGIPEIVDGWGTPLGFIRWAPGLTVLGGPQDGEAPDPFDPRGVFAAAKTFALYPYLFSAGPDKQYEVLRERMPKDVIYKSTMPPNNPYLGLPAYTSEMPEPFGTVWDENGDGRNGALDNISNHGLAASS